MSLEQILSSTVIWLIGTLATLIGMWFKFQNKVENLEKDRLEDAAALAKDRQEDKERFEKEMQRIKEVNALQWQKLDDGVKWEVAHEKEAWMNRNSLELKIAELHGADQKLETMLISIENKLDSLIERLGK